MPDGGGTLQEIGVFISSVGFPVAVSVYYMAIGYKRTKEHTEAIREMSEALKNNTETIKLLHSKGK